MSYRFTNRSKAGQALARALKAYAGRPDVLVLALPRGGVELGYEIALALQLPLDVLSVRKLGMPGYPEFAIGALCLLGEVQILNQALIQEYGFGTPTITALVAQETAELRRREQIYRGGRPLPAVAGKCVIVVDDGLATGATMHAAVTGLRRAGAARIVVAAPTAAEDAITALEGVADEVLILLRPDPFLAVGASYLDFPQLSDAEVLDCLERANARPGAGALQPADNYHCHS